MPAAQPRIAFDPALPISGAVDEIRAALAGHQVVVVAGETGSGKTTQLPKIALAAGRKRIAHTQPRRIAARSVATRIASEMGVELGTAVGYQVRFTRQATKATAVKLMTDGILLAEIAHDRDLRAYDTIIIDEAHERSLNIDFLLGYLKQLLPRRPDLKVIITSATIDTARFSEHFDDAPIIEVSGRTYPVEIVYEPLTDADDLAGGVAAAVKTLHALGDGDILVFCSGERDIRDAADAIGALKLRNTEVLPLYARLSAAEQDRVFKPHEGLRVVLATNVAETSLTVPGIRSVVDPGLARISRYSARTKVQRLPIEEISQASANQRSGRCGRVGPGIAIRLYDEEDFAARPAFTEPEILRTNLASVILQMADARLGPIEDFPFVEPPDRSQVRDGLRLLRELGALADDEPGRDGQRLTPTGRLLARLPVDPRLGRMLVEAGRRGVLAAMIPIVAALAIPDVRERPSDKQAEADTSHRRFWLPADAASGSDRDASDLAATWRLWRYLREQRRERSGNAFRRMCRDEFLNFLRIREWQDLVTQLRDITKELELDEARAPRGGGRRGRGASEQRGRERSRPDAAGPDAEPDWDAVHTSALAGLLSHVGLKETRGDDKTPQRRGRRPLAEYLGARGARFAIQPGSAAAKAEPPLVAAVELVETTRLWGRTVVPVTAEMVEAVGAHLLVRQYGEPRWSASRGQVVADERVLLLGVPIVAGRTVGYARVDPVVAREIFLRSALVEGQWRTRHHFFARNERARAEAQELEERTRRRDIAADDDGIYAFYDRRVPTTVTGVVEFDRWWRDKRREEDRFLDFSVDDLIEDVSALDVSEFPDSWTVGPTEVPVSYTFDPGAGRDGVSVEVDVSVLNQVDAAPFTWQVPGLRTELATELIRALPKAVRTRFVPAPDWARRALTWLDERPEWAQRPFPDAFAAALGGLSGGPVDPALFSLDALPEHLRVHYVITDGTKELGTGTDFEALRTRYAPRLNQRLNATSELTHAGATSWKFGVLPATTEIARRPTPLVGYPALVDQGDTVGVRVANTPEKAARWHALGLRRLIALDSPDPTRSVFAHLSNPDRIALASGPYENLNALLADARLRAIADRLAALRLDPGEVRDEAAFVAAKDAVRPDVAERMQAITRQAASVLSRATAVRSALAGQSGPSVSDARAQLDNLVFAGFIAATPEPHFTRLDRYLHALANRVAAWRDNPAREAQHLETISALEDAYDAAIAGHPVGELPAAASEVGWLLEELRVSLFAQSLGTAQSVSAKRVRTAIAALAARRAD
ncbi:ATP-dependent RNA helicase HrpA [Propioniciclava coleopterorum]|uniref:ATP-dependent RNA helicase HrpA n=1 Tax=Propioniciclava coleopterorum TaxID=2714937 RepID=UPI00140DAEDF|nr:ATP-dependent RNA helicase HrpA [Propioniciclava coleopterorum]